MVKGVVFEDRVRLRASEASKQEVLLCREVGMKR